MIIFNLYLIRKAFGEEVLFSREIVKEGDIARLLLKAKNGAVKGVMMPLRTCDDRKSPKDTIDTHPAAEVCKENHGSEG